MVLFQSTPPVKAATPLPLLTVLGSDISIHAAREGGDRLPLRTEFLQPLFQSTPPVKAATVRVDCFWDLAPISIHAAREGGDECFGVLDTPTPISIHAAREGGDWTR